MQKAGPLSQKMFAVAKEFIPGGVNSPVRAFRNVGGEPFFVRRGAGSRIEDIDGKTYIDYIGSWGPNILGHAPVVITNTIPLTDAAKACKKIRQLSVAFLFAETIRRISDGESVTSLFSEQNNNF